MNNHSKIRISILLFLFLITACSFSAKAGEGDGQQSRKVRVGWYTSEHFQEGEADLARKSGYSYEYLQDVSNYTGWEYEYVPGGWSDLYDALLDGQIRPCTRINGHFTKSTATGGGEEQTGNDRGDHVWGINFLTWKTFRTVSTAN